MNFYGQGSGLGYYIFYYCYNKLLHTQKLKQTFLSCLWAGNPLSIIEIKLWCWKGHSSGFHGTELISPPFHQEAVSLLVFRLLKPNIIASLWLPLTNFSLSCPFFNFVITWSHPYHILLDNHILKLTNKHPSVITITLSHVI